MITKFAVLTEGEDCWMETDEDGVTRPLRFASFDDAQRELEAHFQSMDAEGMDYEPAEYKIVEVK